METQIVQANKFDQDQVDLIKRMVAKDATDDELKLFLYQAQRTGLDPLARQIVFQKFMSKDGKSNVSIITTVDGYRLIADRTERYAGSDDYRFDEGLSEYNHITAGRGIYPTTATVTVYKIVAGQRAPFTSTARWDEYYPGDGKRGFMWRKMPYLMLGKCAEALSLRKAFPAELSGLYTREEMEQAEVFDVQVTEIPETPLIVTNTSEKIAEVAVKVKKAAPPKKETPVAGVRPFPPEKVRQKLEANKHPEFDPSDAQRNLLRHGLELCFDPSDEAVEDKRHTVLAYLTGHSSTKETSGKMFKAIIEDWLKMKQPSDGGGAYAVDPMAIKEAQSIVTEALKLANGS